MSRGIGQIRSEGAGQWLDVPIECEAEILHGPNNHESLTPPLPLERHGRLPATGVASNRPLADLRALNAGARHAESVSEIAERPCDGPPAAADRAAADARLPTVCRLLIDDEIERHDLGQKVRKDLQCLTIAIGELGW